MVRASFPRVYRVTHAVQAVRGTCCFFFGYIDCGYADTLCFASLRVISDSRTDEMTFTRNDLYEFKLDHSEAETIDCIRHVKGDGALDNCTVIR